MGTGYQMVNCRNCGASVTVFYPNTMVICNNPVWLKRCSQGHKWVGETTCPTCKREMEAEGIIVCKTEVCIPRPWTEEDAS